MNQPPQTVGRPERQCATTSKRIVSREEYIDQLYNKVLTSTFGVILLCFCLLGAISALLILSLGLAIGLETSFGGILILLAIFLGSASGYFGYLSRRILREATQLDVGVPLTRANTADLPAPDSLLRASVEPVQEQEAVLLRAATETQEGHEEQLVRASAGGTEQA